MKKKRSKEDLIAFLESQWPGKRSREIREAFVELKKIAKPDAPAQPLRPVAVKPSPAKSFNILEVVRRTCSAHDFLFLSRQITYHISASADLKPVAGNESQIEAVISELITYVARRAPYNSRIGIELKETVQRQGPAVEVIFKTVDEKIGDISCGTYLEGIFGGRGEGGSSTIIACKEAIFKEGGQLTADLPEPRRPVFRIILRTIAAAPVPMGDQDIFKYDIAIRNIANVRKRFGIRKSQFLVSQIENFVRSLVRHPIDIVTAMHDKGVITAIYETEKGAAQSVASRISSRLGTEKFQIGKMAVDLDFKYQLSALPSIPLRRTGDGQK